MEKGAGGGLAVWRGLVYAGYGSVVLLYGIGAAAFFWKMQAGIVLINIATLAYFLAARRLDRHYGRLFVRESLRLSYGKQMDRAETLEARPEVGSPGLGGLIPARKRGGLAWGIGIRGIKGGRPVNICDVVVCFDKEGTQAFGHKIGLADGIWFQAAESREKGKVLLLLSKSLAKKGIGAGFYEEQGLCDLTGRLGELGRDYLLFAEPDCTKEEERLFLHRFEAVLKREKRGGLALRQDREGISAFLSGRSLDFLAPLRAGALEKSAASRQPELELLLKCAGEQEIWGRGAA